MLRTNEKLNRLEGARERLNPAERGARDSMIDIAVLSLIAIVLKERAKTARQTAAPSAIQGGAQAPAVGEKKARR